MTGGLLCRDRDEFCVWPIVGKKLVRMYVEDTTHYLLDNSSSSDREWKSLFPGDGLVRFGNTSDTYLPSMFHQLRCLDILRLGVVLHADNSTSDTKNREGCSPLELHCLNYLRQIVLCNADLHLYPVGGGPRDYVCRDWGAVYTALYQNQEKYSH
ncbi:hypothetical protein K435DRAFT_829168 [Dendrothele bispora CBS 962.96]|uniref:Uncharacterized protein n=1 Tax=Dendrothele bispora (strain CBS 962.96) TaxID=1314807 RepID=A0A4S8LZA5_DENBC|nr:hypothetical protein K435DRAFT_829168 [Dendrothele bispora CBS 962.96]